MGKISNVLYMIDLLNTGNIYTLKDLSEKIGISERMIRYYKNEICANGVAIETFKGPNGGYFMIDKIRNYTNINKYDIKLLDNVRKFLTDNKFQYKEEFTEFIDKVKKMYSISEEIGKYVSNVDRAPLNDIGEVIRTALKKNEKIEIVYNDVDGGQSQRVIHPLNLFKYKNSYYVTAFCELRNDIRHFEIKRISNIK